MRIKSMAFALCLTLAGIFLADFSVFAQKIPTLELYHGKTCPHCKRELKWIDSTLSKMYPDLKVDEYEVWFNKANSDKMKKRLAEFDMKAESVPTNIIGNEVITGFHPEEILAVFEETYGAPVIRAEEAEKQASWWYQIQQFFKNLFS